MNNIPYSLLEKIRDINSERGHEERAKGVQDVIDTLRSLDEIESPFQIEDGFGNSWTCLHGYNKGTCQLEIVRPGKVQCALCDEQGEV